MIAVLDYGGGNVGSVLKAIEYLGFSAERIDQPSALQSAERSYSRDRATSAP